MTWIVMALLLTVLAMAQLLVPPLAAVGDAKPPLLLALVLYYAMCRPVQAMLVCAMAAGVLQDGLGVTPLGWSLGFYLVAGAAARRLRRLVMTESPLTQVMFGAGAGGVIAVVTALGMLQRGLLGGAWYLVGWHVLWATVLGGLAAPVIFFTAGALDRMVGNIEEEARVDRVR